MTEYVAFLRGINAKRIVTFLDASAKTALKLPHHQDGASILRIKDGVAYTAYARSPKDAVFMRILEQAFGKGIAAR